MPSIHNVLKLQKQSCAELCSAGWEVFASKWWQTCRVDCTDLHISAHLVTMKVCVSKWVSCFPVPETPQTLCHAAALRNQLGISLPGMMWFPHELVQADEENCHLKCFTCLFLGWGSYSLSNTSIQLMQAFKCSPSFSYPGMENTLGICKRSQILISLWQGVFYFKEQGGLCAWNICSATTYTNQFWGSCVLCKATWQVGMNYPTAALFFWKQMVLTHGQHWVICWERFYTKCYFASPSDFGITDCWTWASILHGSLVDIGKQFWCSSTAFDEYLAPLDLWLFPALNKCLSSLFCFMSSNSSNRMLWIWFSLEQGPQENRAGRNLRMLSGPPSSSKPELSLPDKMLAIISGQKIIWGQLYSIR